MIMITEDNMHSDHYEIKGKDSPADMARIYNLEHSADLVTIAFDVDHSEKLIITGAWLGEDELGLSFKDYDELIAMKEVYDDNARQDAAEEGA